MRISNTHVFMQNLTHYVFSACVKFLISAQHFFIMCTKPELLALFQKIAWDNFSGKNIL